MTGATGMIGFQMALELARRGARLVLGCRDPNRHAQYYAGYAG